MSHIIRQSSGATIVLGPFVDDTDGVTAETALSIVQADIRISKNGGAFAQSANASGAIHMENGYYSAILDTQDTNTVGRFVVAVRKTGALPVWREYQVVEEAVYDALYTSTAVGPLLASSDGSGLTEAGGTGDHLTALATQASVDTVDAIVDTLLAALVPVDTTIATLASQTSFTLTAGSADDDAYNGWIAVIQDAATATQYAAGVVEDYTGATKTVTLAADPGVFTMAVTDKIRLLPPSSMGAILAASIGYAIQGAGTDANPWGPVA